MMPRDPNDQAVTASVEIYGRLKEGAHLAGYSFERACGHLEWLLAEDRWTLGGQYDDVNRFLASIKLDEFRIAVDQRKRIAMRIKELQPAASQRAIAGVLGVNGATINRDLAVANATGQPSEISDGEDQGVANATPRRTADLSGAHAAQLIERVSMTRGTLGTGENEWYTPPEYIELARQVLGGIDLDPASSDHAQKAVGAGRHFTVEDNGLNQEWHGRVWLNPPYAQPAIGEFAEKMCEEADAGRVTAAVMLTHNYTDTTWFQGLARHAAAICFTRGRIRFVSPSGDLAAPTQGQVFFYFGNDGGAFRRAFDDVGLVLVRP